MHQVICTAQKTFDGTEFHDVTITVEDDKEDKIVVKAYDVEMDTNGDELRVETCEEGSLEEIQIARPVNIEQEVQAVLIIIILIARTRKQTLGYLHCNKCFKKFV